MPRKERLNADGGKVAVVMPVYGEDQSMTASGLLAISKALAQTAIASRCEVFIISDTQNADAWLGETVAFQSGIAAGKKISAVRRAMLSNLLPNGAIVMSIC